MTESREDAEGEIKGMAFAGLKNTKVALPSWIWVVFGGHRLSSLVYFLIFVWLLSYATISGRLGWRTSTISEDSNEDADALSKAWHVGVDGKLVVPLDAGGNHVELYANETALIRHPLHHLIMDAERRWNDMIGRQSKTLEEAVEGYERRYHRLPPKGFGQWYNFAVARGVILIDEVCEYCRYAMFFLPKIPDPYCIALKHAIQYDQIDRDITPFLALSPTAAQKSRDALSEEDSRWFLKATVTDGLTEIWAKEDVGRGVHRLMNSFEELLPNMTWYTHLHDMGPYTIDQALRDEAKRALAEGTYMTPQQIKRFENPHRNSRKGVLKGCREDAPSLLKDIDMNPKPFSTPRTQTSFEFIHDLITTMDVCHNHALFENQCLFSGVHPRDARLRPLFVSSKTLHGGGIIAPSEYGFDESDGDTVAPWDTRSPKVFWRGSNTGNCFPEHLRNSPRVRLHLFAQNHPHLLGLSDNDDDDDEDVMVKLLNEDYDEDRGDSGSLRVAKVGLREFNAKFMDVGMVGPAIQCGNDEKCAKFEKEVGLLRRVDGRGQGNKFTIDVGKSIPSRFCKVFSPEAHHGTSLHWDVDGNGWSGRFRSLLASGSVVFKFTNFPDWNTDRMMPYYHYIPIQHDFSDLYNNVAFFTGMPNGRGAHDATAKMIGSNAVQYVRNHWRWEDMEVYVPKGIKSIQQPPVLSLGDRET
ncbi:F-actin-capping protein subunit alpha [Tulasnella sp. 332]|nr:F-actin-capping protein subunit alpha [Tulasnella sp. 332]